ncbi:MAG TPA: HupE/UreJ family protein [Paracoccaceae bacterium]|nr:HupE/UreJ family protein [Paracoccaceae bacterium]HMO70237.1 HupE/UreJ family protein [Paracoccaceae bacterium]
MPARAPDARRPSPRPVLLPLAGLLLLMPAVAFGHPGHEAGSPFAAGLSHPVGGADHVLAMVALGVLAAARGARAVWTMPAAFVTAMVAGGAMGAAGLPFPAVEPLILASIVVFGALAALALRLPLVPVLAMVAVFGAAHGWAHGAEGPAGALPAHAAGFAVATAGLHLAGIVLGLAAARAGSWAPRAAGGLAALAGLGLFLTGGGA